MLSTHRNSKSVSCDSLFYERSSLKRKLMSRTPSGTSNISFKNDDYNYLINCNELIKTCKVLKQLLLRNYDCLISIYLYWAKIWWISLDEYYSLNKWFLKLTHFILLSRKRCWRTNRLLFRQLLILHLLTT